MISPKRNTTGKTGPMQLVDSTEVKKSTEEYKESNPFKNKKEKARLGVKYYHKYFKCLESTCGSCGTVYRLPKMKNESEEIGLEDIERFYVKTRKEHCPCCSSEIRDHLRLNPSILLETIELIVHGMAVLKLIALKPLTPPEPKLEGWE